MIKLFLLFSLLSLAHSIVFDDDSCESSHSHSHEHGHGGGHHHGGGRPPRPPPGPRGCSNGYTKFTRPSGDWCMRVFGTNGGPITEPAAQAECRKTGAVVSGLMNAAEVDWAHGQALPLIQKMGKQAGALWIALKRKPACDTGDQSWRKKAVCKPRKTNSFYWTDQSTTGWGGVTWMNYAPDNRRGDQDCAYMLVDSSRPKYWKKVDDYSCTKDYAPSDLWRPMTYVCGKRL